MTAARANISYTLNTNLEQAEALNVALDIYQSQSDTLRPFLQWLDVRVLNPKFSWQEKFFNATSILLVLVSTASAYTLGEDFAETLAGDESNPATTFFKIFCGLMAFVPIAVLVCMPCQAEFQELSADLVGKPRLPLINDRKERRAMVGARFLASFAGLPFFSLSQPDLGLAASQQIMSWSGLFMNYFVCLNVERNLVEKYFISKRQEAPQHSVKRKALVEKIDVAKLAIANMSNEAVTTLKKNYLKILATGIEGKSALQAMQEIFKACNEVVVTVAQAQVAAVKFHKRILDAAIIAMSVISLLVFFEPAMQTVESFLDFIGIEESNFQTCVNVIAATLAIFPNVIFDSMYAKCDGDRIYEAAGQGQRIPGLKTAIAHVISALSATPSAYLTIVESSNALEQATLVPVFVGSTLARALAFDDMLSFFIDAFHKNTPAVYRKNLTGVLDSFRRAVQLIPADIMLALDAELMEQEPAPAKTLRRSKSEPILSSRAAFFAGEVKSAPPLSNSFESPSPLPSSRGLSAGSS